MAQRFSTHGQALLMVTLALTFLCGVLGLAVDVGWAYFIKKSAQAACDAAVLAAADEALQQVGQIAAFACGGRVSCQPETDCPNSTGGPANNIEAGCLYARQNGFRSGGESGRQRVTMASDVGTSPPTAAGVAADYWVTARAWQAIPQLFASLISPWGTASARATAAVVDLGLSGSLILINRENDCLPLENPNTLTCGVNLLVSANDNQGTSAVNADGGIILASQRNGAEGRYAGENTGGGTIRAPFTSIRGSGGYLLSGSAAWIETPRNKADEVLFADPMRGKGQPRPPSGLTDVPIAGGQINGASDPDNPLLLSPGNYFATALNRWGEVYATGDPITLNGYVRFGNDGTGFGNYVVFGGLNVSGNGAVITFEPGRYILAGAKGNPGTLFDVTANATLQDLTSGFGKNSDAGEIFVFTDTNYVGQGQSLEIPALVTAIRDQLKQGRAGIQAGNAGATVNLHGLNRDSAALPADLRTFAPMVMWQDQANSVVKYTADGNIDTSCGNADGCLNTALANSQSAQLVLQGSPNVHFYGSVYQPRGAWTEIQGGGEYEGATQVIAGAFRLQGNANLNLTRLTAPVTRRTVVLVE